MNNNSDILVDIAEELIFGTNWWKEYQPNLFIVPVTGKAGPACLLLDKDQLSALIIQEFKKESKFICEIDFPQDLQHDQ